MFKNRYEIKVNNYCKMGQQQSNIKEQIKDKYTVIKTISPGEYLVKGRKKGEELQLRIMSFLIEDEMSQYINLLQKRKKIKNPHLLELVQYNKVVHQLMCSSTFKLKIISELPFKSIKDDIRERSATNPKKYFVEDQIWSILYSCCHSLYSLYINKFPHESLNTDQIYIDTDGIIKIADSLLVHGTKNYLSLMNQEVKPQDIRYISPQLKNLVDDNNFYQYDREKSDVYILGMIILEISNISPLRYFDPKTKRFYFEIVQTILNQFQQRYSPKLSEILNKMLINDYNIRPSFEQIIQNIEQKTIHTNSNISSKDSTIINDMRQQPYKTFKHVSSDINLLKADLNPVKQKLNFDSKAGNALIAHPPPPPPPLSTTINTQALKFSNFQTTMSNYIPQPPPLLTNPHTQITENQYQSPPFQFSNHFDWKFATASKDPKTNNEKLYTPYQQLLNLSGNLTIPNSHVPVQQQKVLPSGQINGLEQKIIKIQPTAIPPIIQEKSITRRFSESKFGGIQLGLFGQTQKKLIRTQNYPSLTEVKPTPMVGSQLFKKQIDQQIITQIGTFVIQQNKSGRYEGFKQNGKKNGIGRIVYTDGGSYEGQWKDDRMQGYGKLLYPNGKAAYEGYWIQDEFNGMGRVFNQLPENSDRNVSINYLDFIDIEDKWEHYEGEFSHDLRQGKGMIKFINGDKFHGNFKQDVIEGQGAFHKNDGDVIQGTWRNNIFVNN